MNKKAQAITIFIIVGIVLVISFGSILYLAGSKKVNKESNTINLEKEKIELSSQIQYCIKTETKEAVDIYGLNTWSSEQDISAYITEKLHDCVYTKIFTYEGVGVKQQNVTTNVSISDNTLVVNVNYPITLEKKGVSASLDNFGYDMKIKENKTILFDENGFVAQDMIIELKDPGVKIEIPKGTFIWDLSGLEEGKINYDVNEISIRTEGKDIIQAYFDKDVANKVYDLGPDDVWFYPAVKLSIRYDEKSLPEGLSEENIGVVYFDKKLSKWIEVETKVDKINNVATAEIYHFTPYSLKWILEYEDRFINESYIHQFCIDVKNDLMNKVDYMAKYSFIDIDEEGNMPPVWSEEDKTLMNMRIFSSAPQNAMKDNSLKIFIPPKVYEGFTTLFLNRFSSGMKIGQLLVPTARTTNEVVWKWCMTNNCPMRGEGVMKELAECCRNSTRLCMLGQSGVDCTGVLSIPEFYENCIREADRVYFESYNESLNMTKEDKEQIRSQKGLWVNDAPCPPLDENGNEIPLPEGVTCYGSFCDYYDQAYGTEQCYRFPASDPSQQICPETTKLAIMHCPGDDSVRCCVRQEVMNYYYEKNASLANYGIFEQIVQADKRTRKDLIEQLKIECINNRPELIEPDKIDEYIISTELYQIINITSNTIESEEDFNKQTILRTLLEGIGGLNSALTECRKNIEVLRTQV
jgi:hypothetical protein